MVNHIHLHLMPTMNPDGFAQHTRNNRYGFFIVCVGGECTCVWGGSSVWGSDVVCVWGVKCTCGYEHHAMCVVWCMVKSIHTIVPHSPIRPTPHTTIHSTHTSSPLRLLPPPSNDVDLNRDFPDPIEHPHTTWTTGRGTEQPETLAIMNWTATVPFTASASMHEGALLANFPWDGTLSRATQYNATPDDATFRHLATRFSALHRVLHTSSEFPLGITNGAAWYPVYGGMQDWNYIVGGCMDLTLELSENKWPPANTLGTLWLDNKEALIHYPVEATLGGITYVGCCGGGYVGGVVWCSMVGGDNVDHSTKHTHTPHPLYKAPPFHKAHPHTTYLHIPHTAPLPRGTVTHKATGEGVQAHIHIEGTAHNYTNRLPHGAFFRPMAPGSYNVSAHAHGFVSARVHVTV